MKRFNPSAKHPQRARQAWQILVGAAMRRQTLTYLGLSQLMYGKPAAGVLDRILGHVAFYCIDSDLPALTPIVVAKGRGTPGTDIPLEPDELDSERERVFETDWYDICPPSSKALAQSFSNHVD